MARKRIDVTKFVAFNAGVYGIAIGMPPESVGKVHKALAIYVLTQEEQDITEFSHDESIFYKALLNDMKSRWTTFEESCEKRSEARKNYLDKKKAMGNNCAQLPTNSNVPLGTGNVGLCSVPYGKVGVEKESNTFVLSSSSPLVNRNARDTTRGEDEIFKKELVIKELLKVPYDQRKNDFYREVVENEGFKSKYSRELLDSFCAYYTEPVEESGLMLWEDLKYNPMPGKRGTFRISNRLMWYANKNKEMQKS